MTNNTKALLARLESIENLLRRIADRCDGPTPTRSLSTERAAYTVTEVAEIFKRTPYTIRDWCRMGRIRATKTVTRVGGHTFWMISAAEVDRFRREGPLPVEQKQDSRGGWQERS